MASHSFIIAIIFRVFLPFMLALCCAMRFSLSSFCYFIFLMINPLLPSPNLKSMQDHTGRYLKSLSLISFLNFVIQFIFQIVLVSLPPYHQNLPDCTWQEKLLRHIGLVRLDSITEEDGTRWLLPDCLMLVFGPGSHLTIYKLLQKQAEFHAWSRENLSVEPKEHPYKAIILRVLNAIGTYTALILLGLAGIMSPCIPSAAYFFLFLGGATYWSLNNTLERRFGLMCRGVNVLAGVQLTLIYLYQMQFSQEILAPSSKEARVFGFIALQEVRCDPDPRTFHKATREWSRFMTPLVILMLYYFLVYEVHFILTNQGAFLAKPAVPAVRYLIRRTTVQRRSKKSQKFRPSLSDASGQEPQQGKQQSLLSVRYDNSHRRKSLNWSIGSAPTPKQTDTLFGLFQTARRLSVFSEAPPGRRVSVFSDVPRQKHKKHRQLSQPTLPNYSSSNVHQTSTPFQHILKSHNNNHKNRSILYHPYQSNNNNYNNNNNNNNKPNHALEKSSTVGHTPQENVDTRSPSTRSSLSFPHDRILLPHLLNEEQLPENEDSVQHGPNVTSNYLSTEAYLDPLNNPIIRSIPPSTASSQRSSFKGGLSRFNSQRSNSNSNSSLIRKSSVKSVQFPYQLDNRGEKRNSLQVPNTTTIREVREEVSGHPEEPFPYDEESRHDEEDFEESTSSSEEDEHPLQKLIAPLITIFQLVIRSSYIATNIVMMAWSITYHSWLTFVLLMWACVLWMNPNQRAAMLRCSPFLVFYAELLLVLQYIYCMDLTDEELPSEVESVNLGQIGLLKFPNRPVKPLIVKVCYTGMFWLTLRQYVQEVVQVKRGMPTIAALQPFTVAVTTATGQVTSLMVDEESLATTTVMDKFGQWMRRFLSKFWIWLVAVLLFTFGLKDVEVHIFKIMYMVFFLIFLNTFQLSYTIWRKFLYGFWLTVIIYQMFVLVLTYTYQFDNFPQYWENYTGIPEQLQNDIGLEVYDTGRLFVKLMTPTFFVIVTIIQVHYFHESFLELSDIEKATKINLETEKKKDEKNTCPDVCPNLLDSCTLEDLKEAGIYAARKILARVHTFFETFSSFTWRFLEIHIIKIVCGSVMMLACYDVSAFHTVFAFLATIAVPLSQRVQVAICRACVVITSLLLITRMIYQIEYVDEYGIAVNCSDEYQNSTWPISKANESNTAIWLGLHKVTGLASYLKGYIGIIVVITIQAVVMIREEYIRLTTGKEPLPQGIIFPEVTRELADDGMLECFKYLCNYGFYKFGVEICLMTLVSVIGTRLDIYSLVYCGWLCYFFNRRRSDIAKVWKWFIYSIIAMIPLQYLMCVGMPPTICYDYPWAHLIELREWLFFPDFVKPPESYKIMTDFCLLIFAVCQQRVFEIEEAEGESYDGGSNREILYDDLNNLVNPIPDFVTNNKNVLDKVKSVIFFSFYWLTLAVMFLSGTNRTTLFALGYVLCAFVFLWQGNEFYLRPLSTILKLWNLLMGYNVSIIVIKTFLQLLGCVFLESLASNACWFVQLLSIACVKKFGDQSDEELVARLSDVCAVPKSEAGLVWDGICFGFLLLQRRLFSSFYFQHLVTEMKAQTELASRGAELIAELNRKEVIEQQEAEREVLNKIKKKMDQIKATQRKMSRADLEMGAPPPDQYDAGNTLEQFSNCNSPLPPEFSPSPADGNRDTRNQTPGAPTPSNLTISIDGYMEPNRISLSTPHISNAIASPSEEDFPIFSPPPYEVSQERQRERQRMNSTRQSFRGSVRDTRGDGYGYNIGPPWLRNGSAYQTRRTSNTSVSPVVSHHASLRSGDYYMFEQYEDDDTILPIDYTTTATSTPPDDHPLGLTITELLNAALKSDITSAVREARLARMSESEFAISSSRMSSFRSAQRPGFRRTQSVKSQHSGKSAFSLLSRGSRTTSRSVRISEHSEPAERIGRLDEGVVAEHQVVALPPTSAMPPLPPLPPNAPEEHGDGSFYGGDSTVHDYSEIQPPDPKGLSRILRFLYRWLSFGWEFFESLMISITIQLNKISKDYRYVSACLSQEKKNLKETEGFTTIPVASKLKSSENARNTSRDEIEACGKKTKKPKNKDKKRTALKQRKRVISMESDVEITIEKPSDCSSVYSKNEFSDYSVDFFDLPENADRASNEREISVATSFSVAVGYAVVSRSELVSYIMIFVNMMKSASVLALPLPIMVFLWGTLSVPRPSKAFWICIIAYTEAIVLIKYIFQFDFFPWNQEERLNAPFWPPRIMGVEKKERYAVYDLALLLVVFFHRFMLKSLGLWKKSGSKKGDSLDLIASDEVPDEKKVLPDAIIENEPSTSSENASSSSVSRMRSSARSSSAESNGFCRSDRESASKTSVILNGTSTRRSASISTGTMSRSFSSSFEDNTLTQRSSRALYSRDNSLMSSSRESNLSSGKRTASTITPSSTVSGSLLIQSRLPLKVSDIHYTLPYMESTFDDISSLDKDFVKEFSDFSSFTSHDPRSSLSSRKSQIYATPFAGTKKGPDETTLESSSSVRTSFTSYQQPFTRSKPLAKSLKIPDEPEPKDSKSVGRQTSVLSNPVLPSKRLSLLTTGHRRQWSEGSKVSFQSSPLGSSERRGAVQYRKHSLATHSVISDMSADVSDSIHFRCPKINFKRIMDFRPPKMDEIRAQMHKLPELAKEQSRKWYSDVVEFVTDVLNPRHQLSVNVYTYMFICDFANFFLLIFGFSAFGTQQGDGGVSAYLEENRVPIPFLIMLMLQFTLIIIDRALYLRKCIVGKLIYQIGLTFGVHIWMFFILPLLTEREFNAKRPPQIFYMIKCIYLLLAAYQIRCGYPTRILGNFFCKDYTHINNFSFRVFMNVPFLYELRTLMDWIWTNTSMNLSDWIKMEDIFVRIFLLKCERKHEEEYPQKSGEGKSKIFKYGLGGCALLGVISLIWFPLVLFALSSTVGHSNPPFDVGLEISIGSYEPVFQMKAQQQDLHIFSQKDWDDFNYHYRSDRLAQTFLSNYDFGDVVSAELNGNSTAVWSVSPPSQVNMIDDLNSEFPIKTKIRWNVNRKSNSADVSSVSIGEQEVILEPFINGKKNPERVKMAKILNGSLELNPIIIPNLFPKFIKVSNKGTAAFVKQLAPIEDSYVDLKFSLQSRGFLNLSSVQEWWEVEEDCSKGVFSWLPRDKDCRFLTMYTFNEKSFPEGLSFISGGGIVGMYTTIVLLVSKMLRVHFAGVSSTIMFDDMPNVDRLLQLCLDIYLVRESKELVLEEDLFAKLIFLFRSPETLIKWTRPKEEDHDQDKNSDDNSE